MAFIDKKKTSNITIKTPKEMFTDILKMTSGADYKRRVAFDIFYKIIAFKGISDGVGTSTIVANTALALAKLGLTVCVFDSSILHPAQDVLLKTNWKDVEEPKRLDWFDIMYTSSSVLHESKLDKNISVLSFKGKNRDITSMMGTQDSDLLVEVAIAELQDLYDVILIDCCQEPTKISAGCLQLSQKVIQVWSDTPHIISNIDMWVTNNVILSCPLDKMRYVVINKYVDDIHSDFSDMLRQYRFIELTSCSLSLDIARVNAIGKTLWGYVSSESAIVEFNDCIKDIVCHILNIEDSSAKNRGTVTSSDIEDGLVEGTLHAKLKEDDIANIIEDVDIETSEVSSHIEDFTANAEDMDEKPRGVFGFFGRGNK